MCNLYSMTRAQDAMRQLFPAAEDRLGNLAPLPMIYPDQMAPILRNGAQGAELVKARWGLPTPQKFLEGHKTDRGVTNVRNTASAHWRRWLGPAIHPKAMLTILTDWDTWLSAPWTEAQHLQRPLPDDEIVLIE